MQNRVVIMTEMRQSVAYTALTPTLLIINISLGGFGRASLIEQGNSDGIQEITENVLMSPRSYPL